MNLRNEGYLIDLIWEDENLHDGSKKIWNDGSKEIWKDDSKKIWRDETWNYKIALINEMKIIKYPRK